MHSNEAGKQLAAWKAANLSRYEPFVDDVTGLILGAEYIAQTTISCILATVLACVKPSVINYVMFANPFAMNVVKTTQIQRWWYEEIAKIDTAQRNSDPAPSAKCILVTGSPKECLRGCGVQT